jgi:uncharacterized membrane protein
MKSEKRDHMRYIVTIFWGAILGQVVGFLISALNSATYDPKLSLVISVIFAVILWVLPLIMDANTSTTKPTQHQE